MTFFQALNAVLYVEIATVPGGMSEAQRDDLWRWGWRWCTEY